MQRDTIIRTDESRVMGAKFLDNADLGTREECLRLCCETDGCDVFVFEEKVRFFKHNFYLSNYFEVITHRLCII